MAWQSGRGHGLPFWIARFGGRGREVGLWSEQVSWFEGSKQVIWRVRAFDLMVCIHGVPIVDFGLRASWWWAWIG